MVLNWEEEPDGIVAAKIMAGVIKRKDVASRRECAPTLSSDMHNLASHRPRRAAPTLPVSEMEKELQQHAQFSRAEQNILHVLAKAIEHKRSLYGHTIETTRDLFESIDYKGSGFLTSESMAEGLHRLGLGLTARDTETLMLHMHFDENQDGNISYEEFAKALHGHRGFPSPNSRRHSNAQNKSRSPADRAQENIAWVMAKTAHPYTSPTRHEEAASPLPRQNVTRPNTSLGRKGTGTRRQTQRPADFAMHRDIKKAKAAHARLYANKVKKPPKISPARIAAKRKHDKVKVEEWEANLFHVIQMAIRHKRTLYGRTVKDVKSLFDIIDRDGDRKLTLRKVSDAFRRLGLGLTPQEVRILMKHMQLDANSNGDVSYNEFVRSVEGHEKFQSAGAHAHHDHTTASHVASRQDVDPRAENARDCRQPKIRGPNPTARKQARGPLQTGPASSNTPYSHRHNSWMAEYNWRPVRDRVYVSHSDGLQRRAGDQRFSEKISLTRQEKMMARPTKEKPKEPRGGDEEVERTTADDGKEEATRKDLVEQPNEEEKYKPLHKVASEEIDPPPRKQKSSLNEHRQTTAGDGKEEVMATDRVEKPKNEDKHKPLDKVACEERASPPRRKKSSLYEQVLRRTTKRAHETYSPVPEVPASIPLPGSRVRDAQNFEQEAGDSSVPFSNRAHVEKDNLNVSSTSHDSNSSSDGSSSSRSSSSSSSSSSSDDSDSESEIESVENDRPAPRTKKRTPMSHTGSAEDRAFLRRCESLAEYAFYLQNKYGVKFSSEQWKQVLKSDFAAPETNIAMLRVVQKEGKARSEESKRSLPSGSVYSHIRINDPPFVTPIKGKKVPPLPVVEYQDSNTEEEESEKVRALIKARVAADVEQAKRQYDEEKERDEYDASLKERVDSVSRSVEMEQIRRAQDVEGEIDRQRGARRMSLNFINDLIQKDPDFIAKTWGY